MQIISYIKIRLLFWLLNSDLPKFNNADLKELIMNEMWSLNQGEYYRTGYTIGEKVEIVYHTFKNEMGWSENDFHEFKR